MSFFFTNLKMDENMRKILLPVGLEPTSPFEPPKGPETWRDGIGKHYAEKEVK